jgi:hypothetical protein
VEHPIERALAGTYPSKAMKYEFRKKLEAGKIGWILLWLLGVPIPILLGFFLLRGCT